MNGKIPGNTEHFIQMKLYPPYKKNSPDVTLYCATVASANGEVYAHDFLSGIKWAIEQDVNVIHMSLGFKQNIEESLPILKVLS